MLRELKSNRSEKNMWIYMCKILSDHWVEKRQCEDKAEEAGRIMSIRLKGDFQNDHERYKRFSLEW